MNKGTYNFSLFVKTNKDHSSFSNPEVYYRVHNYDELRARIRDSIRRTYTPDDLMQIYCSNLEFMKEKDQIGFTKLRLSITSSGYNNYKDEEERDITDVKYDIVFCNRFEEEIFRIPNIEIHFEESIPRNSQIRDFKVSYRHSFVYRYPLDEGLSKLVHLHSNDGLVIKPDVEAIRFEDGKILKN